MTQQQSLRQLLAEMTVPEKVGQMTQVSNESISPSEVGDSLVGSVLSGGNGNPSPNTPAVWADMVGQYIEASTHTRLRIPLVYGLDAVHGHSNVAGATVFPHSIGLGAAGDPTLVERIGRATASEMLATGVRWAFTPVLAVPHDIRWGRTYEGYGRDPKLVGLLGAAAVRGLQGAGSQRATVLACAKHFVGDGGTTWGTAPRIDWTTWWDGWGDAWQIDQGDTRIDEHELRTLHLAPYRAAIDAGVMTVMASYSSWNGLKLHAHRHLLTDVLKIELGFRGFVVSDWMGIDQISPDYQECVVKAINAGVDMVMVPDEYTRFQAAMTDALKRGTITLARLDDAVLRILRAKQAAGLFDADQSRPSLDTVGSQRHRDLAAEAVRRSAVLLTNNGALPLPAGADIHVAGAAADDLGVQCGGWTVGWQGGLGRTTTGTTLVDGLRASSDHIAFDPEGRFDGLDRADVGVVCIGEPPYAEGPGDRAIPRPSDVDRAVVARMRAHSRHLVLVVFSGRPLVMPELIEQADAVVAAWLPGSEGSALADLLWGRSPFTATTPQPWPKGPEDLNHGPMLFDIGHGLTLSGTATTTDVSPGVTK